MCCMIKPCSASESSAYYSSSPHPFTNLEKLDPLALLRVLSRRDPFLQRLVRIVGLTSYRLPAVLSPAQRYPRCPQPNLHSAHLLPLVDCRPTLESSCYACCVSHHHRDSLSRRPISLCQSETPLLHFLSPQRKPNQNQTSPSSTRPHTYIHTFRFLLHSIPIRITLSLASPEHSASPSHPFHTLLCLAEAPQGPKDMVGRARFRDMDDVWLCVLRLLSGRGTSQGQEMRAAEKRNKRQREACFHLRAAFRATRGRGMFGLGYVFCRVGIQCSYPQCSGLSDLEGWRLVLLGRGGEKSKACVELSIARWPSLYTQSGFGRGKGEERRIPRY